jgi:hypothetical protein
VIIIRDNLRENISLDGASANEKFDFLLSETCLKEYGETNRLLRAFVATIDENETKKIVEVANYLRHVLKNDLTEYSSLDMSELFENAESNDYGFARSRRHRFQLW